MLDDLLDSPALFFGLDLVVGRQFPTGQQIGEGPLAVLLTARPGIEWDLRPSGTAPQPVASLVGRDGEQPGLESAGWIEAGGREVDLKKCLLDHVLSRGRATGEPQDELVQLPVVTPHQGLKTVTPVGEIVGQ